MSEIILESMLLSLSISARLRLIITMLNGRKNCRRVPANGHSVGKRGKGVPTYPRKSWMFREKDLDMKENDNVMSLSSLYVLH